MIERGEPEKGTIQPEVGDQQRSFLMIRSPKLFLFKVKGN